MPIDPQSHIILLHGLGRSAKIMQPLQNHFQNQSLATTNFEYPSTHYPIETLAENYLIPLLQTPPIQQATQVHFVCHSLGSILVRYALEHYALNNLGRTVMCAPPNQGSELAHFLWRFFWFRKLFGPAAGQLATGPSCLPLRLGPAKGEVGVIMGDRCYNPFYWPIMPSPSDGKVTVASAYLTGMRDFKLDHFTHAGIVQHPKAIAQIDYFLKNGCFKN